MLILLVCLLYCCNIYATNALGKKKYKWLKFFCTFLIFLCALHQIVYYIVFLFNNYIFAF